MNLVRCLVSKYTLFFNTVMLGLLSEGKVSLTFPDTWDEEQLNSDSEVFERYKLNWYINVLGLIWFLGLVASTVLIIYISIVFLQWSFDFIGLFGLGLICGMVISSLIQLIAGAYRKGKNRTS